MRVVTVAETLSKSLFKRIICLRFLIVDCETGVIGHIVRINKASYSDYQKPP